MRFRSKKDRSISAMDITPMVDVVFLLLIFFMLSFGSPIKQSDIDLPEASAGEKLSPESISVLITNEGTTIGEKTVTDAELENLPADKNIVILAQKDVEYFKVVHILDVLRTSGHPGISLATKPLRD